MNFVLATTGSLAPDQHGNMLPQTQTVVYQAILKEAFTKDDLRIEPLPGVDATSLYLEGWVVGQVVNGVLQDISTAFLPVEIPTEVSAVLDGKEGKLQILPGITNPYGVEQRIGQKIAAYFSYRKGGAGAL